MDVATTAGALADKSAAVQTLPGATTVGESGRLFVRGGDADETNIYIDGLLVPTPYFSNSPNVGTSGRINPFLFSGAVFSTGGYSAEYGQALSSVLLLNTRNIKEEDELNVALFSVGGDVTGTKRWKNRALTVTANYFDLTPYLKIASHNQDMTKPPMMTSNELSYKQKTGKYGMLKAFLI
ncbi:MAG: TonB-dependent receptor plug domain-containing protein [Bacteroidetes bacterium]|nr:TonB-dependent receptor plug domain-containing protein [Bacteroidota bacterium]MDA1122092.1 TonB-dependent receptor plug domain-containing protein [Bacteroidota bacterium]